MSRAGTPAAPADNARRWELVAALLLIVTLVALFWETSPGYDSQFALAWGNDLLHGRELRFDTLQAPTPHPLSIAVSTIIAATGSSAGFVLLVVNCIAVGALVLAVYRLTVAVSGSRPAGLVAALVLLTRPRILSTGIEGGPDVSAVALIVWAGVLDAEGSVRKTRVMGLLVLAGLLRPEAWILAAGFVMLVGWRAGTGLRVRLGLLALVAPLTWMTMDLAVTGDPFWSLNGTSELARELGRTTGITNVPQTMRQGLGSLASYPVLLAGCIGLVVAARDLRRRATAVTLAIGVASVITYVLIGVAGLSLIERYLFLGVSVLTVFVGLAATTLMSAGSKKRTGAGVVAAGCVAVAVVSALLPIGQERKNLAAKHQSVRALSVLLADPAIRAAAARCPTIYTPTTRYFPASQYALDVGWNVLRSVRVTPISQGLLVRPRTAGGAKPLEFEREPGDLRARNPANYRMVAENALFAVSGPVRCLPSSR